MNLIILDHALLARSPSVDFYPALGNGFYRDSEEVKFDVVINFVSSHVSCIIVGNIKYQLQQKMTLKSGLPGLSILI